MQLKFVMWAHQSLMINIPSLGLGNIDRVGAGSDCGICVSSTLGGDEISLIKGCFRPLSKSKKILPSVFLGRQSQISVFYFGSVIRSKVDQPSSAYDQ